MKLNELLSPFFSLPQEDDTSVLRITERSAEADQSTVFVCVKGAGADGHQYAADAYSKGCRVFLAEHPLALPSDARVLITENTRRLIGPLASKLLDEPSKKMKVVCVTGTKGKTTVAKMLAHVLNENGIPTGYVGTNGICYASVQRDTANTTPDPVTLQAAFFEMQAAGMRAVVLEVSSQALKQYRVSGTHVHTAIFTNLFRDHIGINEHPDLEDYHACKRKLFTELLPRLAILNADDPATPFMIEGTTADRAVYCSTAENDAAEYFIPSKSVLAKKDPPSVRFSLQKPIACHGSLALIGKANVSNALLAVACAKESFSIPIERSLSALKDFTIAGRAEWIPLPNGARVVIDYAHNGESLKTLLLSLKEYASGRILCLFGSVGGRTQERRYELGSVAARYSDLAFITSDNPHNESPDRILDDIASAFESSSTPYYKIADRESAILFAISQTRRGDVLVLAGKGHEQYQLVGNERFPFCEREIVYKAASHASLEGSTV